MHMHVHVHMRMHVHMHGMECDCVHGRVHVVHVHVQGVWCPTPKRLRSPSLARRVSESTPPFVRAMRASIRSGVSRSRSTAPELQPR